MDLSKIEQKILDRELAEIEARIGKIGADLIDVFSKYGTLRGQHGASLAAYIVEKVITADERYYMGNVITSARLSMEAGSMPDELKKLILKWAVDDFFEKFDEVKEIIDEK